MPPSGDAIEPAAATGYMSDRTEKLQAADGEVRSIPFMMSTPPKFETVAEERKYRKERLTMAIRLFGKYGFDEGVAGHLTVRDPEFPDTFWVNPFGMAFKLIKVSDLIRVNEAGEVIEGNRPVNAAAFAIHSGIHKTQPWVTAAAHSHSMYGKVWSTLLRKLDPITQDACAFYERQEVYDDYTGVVDDKEEGKLIGKLIGKENHLVILSNHGLLTAGRSVDECFWWFLSAERQCQAQILAESVGKPKILTHEVATKTRGLVGTTIAGWFQAQPYFDIIAKEQPDLFE
ncbi:class II aldolase/adducin N-terminal [Hyaloraphidium curvatum]|nr:class II aldolase/adducin N-terminal [Hyaloraphidium curvatum]